MKKQVLFVAVLFVIVLALIGCQGSKLNPGATPTLAPTSTLAPTPTLAATPTVIAAAPTGTPSQTAAPVPSPTTSPVPAVNTQVPTVQPTSAPAQPTVAPTSAPRPITGSPSNVLNQINAALLSSGNDYVDAHNARLYDLELKYIKRDASGVPSIQSLQDWLRGAGYTFDSLSKQARQPEEETIILANGNRKKVVSGIQLQAVNLKVRHPGCFTTDRRYSLDPDGRALKIAVDNPSVLVTNGGVSDTLTAYGSCLNWPNLMTEGQGPTVSPLSNAPTNVTTQPIQSSTGCYTIAELDTKFGIDRRALGSQNGLLYDGSTLAGTVLRLTPAQESELSALGWTIQGSNPEVKSAWSPSSCRPLSK